jgi:glutamyl-Q tRNA(Asp) synthetase
VNAPPSRYRGRFAPSPTGPLHFGSLVAALASFCDARHAGGEWLLRIEDVDLPRTQDGAEGAILDALARHGFEWDGPVVRQSERTGLYETALATLRAQDDVFPCACTRRDLDDTLPGAAGDRVYPGTCRNGIPAGLANRTQRAWRLRIDRGLGPCVAFRDRLQGTLQQHLAAEVGDFVVKRADGLFAYHFAVVVDDAAQAITHVVRGADLLASTPRQIYLQQRLCLATPSYLHVPVAIDARGEKLSKQTHAPPLPDDALPNLWQAWTFLDQLRPEGSAAPVTIREFWAYATAAWNPARLPPAAMLPAPFATGSRAARSV